MSKYKQAPRRRRYKSGSTATKSHNTALYFAAAAMVLAVLAVIFFVVANSYRGHFLNRTTVNGVDASGKTAEEVSVALEERGRNYKLTLKEREKQEESITGEDISLSYGDQGDVQKLLNKISPYGWLFSYFHDTDLTLSKDSLQYDEKELKENLSNLRAFNPAYELAPTDAKLVQGDGVFTIQKENLGYKLKKKKVQKTVQNAIEKGASELNLDKSGCYEEPKIYSDDKKLNQELEKVNSYLKADIKYDFKDRKIPVEKKDIMDMISRKDDGTYYLDEEKVQEFVKVKLAYKTDTFGLTHHFKTHDGEEITLHGGDYGWCINRGKTAEKLSKLIKKAESKTLEPEYIYTAKFREKNDIGDSYVEISISDQNLWCYKDGKVVVDTPVVTGNTSRGNGTPTGSVWAIDAKKSPATLGTIETMGYSSPVSYWMPFTGNVGMHDADGWRTQYGGSIYRRDGSHGCVNMPYSAAKEVYSSVEIGTAVIVY